MIGTLITELDTFTGVLSDSTYLLIDNGSASYKIGADSLTGVVEVYIEEASTLPQTVSDSQITADMAVVQAIVYNPSAQASDWTVTTSAGSVTISGSISGVTNISLLLAPTK